MPTINTRDSIHIFQDGVWAGDGRLDNGMIVDCAAILGGSQDAADEIYEEIEATIESGENRLTTHGHRFDWTVGK